MNFVNIRIGFCIVLVCFMAVGSWADSRLERKKKDEITAIYKAVNRTGFGPDWKFAGGNNVYVYVTTGAGYVDISVVGSYMASGMLANDIYRSAIINSEPNKKIAFGEVAGDYAVSVQIQKPGYGAKMVTNNFRLGAFVAELKSGGWNPYVLLRIPNYAACEFTGVEKSRLPALNRIRFDWYNATGIPKNATIQVSASVPPGLSAFLVYIRFVLPGIGLLAALVGFIGGLDRRFPIKIRISIYDWGTLICLLVFFAMLSYYWVFLLSLYHRIIADMWLADPTDKYALISYLIVAGILFVVAFIMMPIRTRLYRGKDEEPELDEIDALVNHLRKSGKFIMYSCLAFTACLLIVRPFQINHTFSDSLFLFILAPLLSRFVSRFEYLGYYNPSIRDEDLTLRAKQLAAGIGVDVKEVRVITSDYGKKTICGFANCKKKIVRITKKAAEELSQGQMDFILGHELAHFKDIEYRNKMFSKFDMYCLVFIYIVVCFIMLFTYNTSLLVLWLIGLVLPIMFVPGVYMTGLARRLEYEADIQSVLLTGDVNTAITALETMHESVSGKLNLDDDNGIHPKLIKRIKAIRIAGEKLKLDS